MRPSTATASPSTPSRSATTTSAATTVSATGGSATRSRPQSANADTSIAAVSSQRGSLAANANNTFKPTKDKANTSSDELIRDLESKVRKVVEQKRAESDKLRFAVGKKRDDVEKAKRILQDLLKDSDALGLHYDLGEPTTSGSSQNDTYSLLSGHHHQQQHVAPILHKDDPQDATRLQPIASISRRPVYSKHTNIHELEGKLQRRAKEALVVHRRTVVLDHIKKRLLNERIEVGQTTNQLKQLFTDLTNETQELQKREIAAAEAVSQEQSRLAQQKADMATNVRKFKCELALRLKWAREKTKFEKYYNDQLQAVTTKTATHSGDHSHHHHHQTPTQGQGHHVHYQQSHSTTAGGNNTGVDLVASVPRRQSTSPVSILKNRRSNSGDRVLHDEAIEQMHSEAFHRIGVDPRVDAIDPEEIIRICLSHDELKKELDTKHDEAVERIAMLREQINKARSAAREDIPLSKRGTSQKIETKQLEISSVERQLATVVDQYMFVEQSVRPIKIGLQQILQNVSSATVNSDDMDALETCLVDSCEEMTRLMRAASNGDGNNPDQGSVATIPEDEDDEEQQQQPQDGDGATPKGKHASPQRVMAARATAEDSSAAPPHGGLVSLENFTSPYNIRIAAKKRERYFVAGLTRPSAAAKADEEEDTEENAFDVMDRAMVKRISSVVLCTTAGKKPTGKATEVFSTTTTAATHHHSPTRHHTT